MGQYRAGCVPPAGFTAGDIRWPHPERIRVAPAMSYGYATVHSVWHDPRNDFGADVLRAHYEHGHRHHRG